MAGTSHWTAILTVVLKPPATADVLRKNPLGLYVDAIDWSRELEPPAPPAPLRPVQPTSPPANLPLGSPLDPTLGQQPLAQPNQETPQ